MWNAIGQFLAGLFGGIFNKWFPPKSANDQKLTDAQTQLKDIANADKANDHIDGESDSNVRHDLSKWVR